MSSVESETNNNNQQLAVKPKSLRWYLEDPASGYQQRLQQLLGERAPQFCASLINLANSSKAFDKVRPTSIISAGVVAATLDLPIDKNLGFAWVIPYGELAQFQIGYKGYLQLALRSGRYAGMNAVLVNAEALGGYDNIGDPLIKWDQLDETQPAIGYAFAWRLTTGFTKIVYWPKSKVEAHALRYSQAYKQKKRDSPWFTDFDKMALKTLITNALRRWGMMSVEDRGLQLAYERDQSAAIDVDAVPIYPDNDQPDPEPTPQETTPPPADLSDLTEKLNGNGKAETTTEKAPPPEPVTPEPLHLVKEAAKVQPMTIDEIKERLGKAVYVTDVRALKLLWCGPKTERGDAEKEQITELCDLRIEEIKSAGRAQKG